MRCTASRCLSFNKRLKKPQLVDFPVLLQTFSCTLATGGFGEILPGNRTARRKGYHRLGHGQGHRTRKKSANHGRPHSLQIQLLVGIVSMESCKVKFAGIKLMALLMSRQPVECKLNIIIFVMKVPVEVL